jgi:hypothetical protein
MRRFPNGCGHKGALREGVWDLAALPKLAVREWVVWHAACILGMQPKLAALTGLMTALQSGAASGKQAQ